MTTIDDLPIRDQLQVIRDVFTLKGNHKGLEIINGFIQGYARWGQLSPRMSEVLDRWKRIDGPEIEQYLALIDQGDDAEIDVEEVVTDRERENAIACLEVVLEYLRGSS